MKRCDHCHTEVHGLITANPFFCKHCIKKMTRKVRKCEASFGCGRKATHGLVYLGGTSYYCKEHFEERFEFDLSFHKSHQDSMFSYVPLVLTDVDHWNNMK